MQKAKTTIKFVLAFLFENLIVCIYLEVLMELIVIVPNAPESCWLFL